MNMIKNFLKDESGLELTEYAVAAALIVAGLIAAFSGLGAAIQAKIEGLTATIK